jgi:hypothetical protein
MAVVILTGVSTVITKGSLSSNGHRYIRRGLHSKESLGMTVVEERSLSLTAIRDSRTDSSTELVVSF